MTYTVVWSVEAARARRRLREVDPEGEGAALRTAAITTLAKDPRPDNAATLGGSGWFWLRLSHLRATYEVPRRPARGVYQ